MAFCTPLEPPLARPKSSRYFPDAMKNAPMLDPFAAAGTPEPNSILLIQPFYCKDPNGSFAKHVLTPSTALSSLASCTPPEWKVRFWDENLLQGPPPLEPFPKVVGITVHLTFARRAAELAQWYRARGAIVVMGGLHVTACPYEMQEHADILVMGNGIEVWAELLGDIETGKSRPLYRGSFGTPCDEEPVPLRSVIPANAFLTTAGLIATRGCKNRCGFCYLSTSGLKMPYQCREAEEVAREFAALDEPYAVFLDNNLGSDREYLTRLCTALRPLERIWSGAVSIDVTDDPTLVQKMAISGCTGVFVGFETLDLENLRQNGKRVYTPDEYANRVRIFHENGIQVNGSFVFGFDHDEPDVFKNVVSWIEMNRLECATFHILTPYPGTPLFRKLEAQGRIIHRNWDLYDTSHVVFQPARMSAEELQFGYERAYKELFSPSSIWQRRPSAVQALPAYLAMSVLYKKMNVVWPWMIKAGIVHKTWRPLVELSRKRHLRFRNSLAGNGTKVSPAGPVYAGV